MTPGPTPIATSLGIVAVRPRTDDDIGLLRVLLAAGKRDELRLMGWGPEQERSFVDLQMRAREQHREATRPGADLGIVTLDGLAVGQLDLHRGDEAVEVVEIAVVPGLQGHGLGTAVLTQVLAEADDAGVVVRLNVEPGNPARRLYERLGFVATGPAGPTHLGMERPVGGAAPAGPAPAPPPTPEPRPGGPGPDAGAGTDLDPAAIAVSVPTYDDLAPHVGAAVAVGPDGPELELVEVTAQRRPGHAGTVAYSALLAGPLDRPLDQGIHELALPGWGPIALFIVPLGPHDGRALYELVVS